MHSNCKGTNKSITSHPCVAVLWYIFSLVTHYSLRIEIRAHGNMRKREVWSSTMSQPRSCFSGGEVKMLKFLSLDENEMGFFVGDFLSWNMWNASLTWGGLNRKLSPLQQAILYSSATESLSRCISPRISTRLIYIYMHSKREDMFTCIQALKMHWLEPCLPHIGSSDYLTIPSAYRVREVEKDIVCGGFSTFTGQLWVHTVVHFQKRQ